jgi:hypothetical protein
MIATRYGDHNYMCVNISTYIVIGETLKGMEELDLGSKGQAVAWLGCTNGLGQT